MAVLLNLDAVEHWPGRHTGTLKALGQRNMPIGTGPFGQPGVERVAVLPARELIGECRFMRPRRITHYFAKRLPFGIIAYRNGYPLVFAGARISIVRCHHVVAIGPLPAIASI